MSAERRECGAGVGMPVSDAGAALAAKRHIAYITGDVTKRYMYVCYTFSLLEKNDD